MSDLNIPSVKCRFILFFFLIAVNYVIYSYSKNLYQNFFSDFNECTVDGSCDQVCQNSPGSFSCACVEGYNKTGTHCVAENGKNPSVQLKWLEVCVKYFFFSCCSSSGRTSYVII